MSPRVSGDLFRRVIITRVLRFGMAPTAAVDLATAWLCHPGDAAAIATLHCPPTASFLITCTGWSFAWQLMD